MKKLLLTMLVILLTGCQLIDDSRLPGSITDQPQTPPSVDQPVEPPVIVEPPPKQFRVNWQPAIEKLIGSLLATEKSESEGNVLLVGQVKNETNRQISTQTVESVLLDHLMMSDRFTLISADALHHAKQILGIAVDDNLVTRSKLVGLARYVKADYILSTVLSGTTDNPRITMQLMLTSTGELLWSKSQNADLVEMTGEE